MSNNEFINVINFLYSQSEFHYFIQDLRSKDFIVNEIIGDNYFTELRIYFPVRELKDVEVFRAKRRCGAVPCYKGEEGSLDALLYQANLLAYYKEDYDPYEDLDVEEEDYDPYEDLDVEEEMEFPKVPHVVIGFTEREPISLYILDRFEGNPDQMISSNQETNLKFYELDDLKSFYKDIYSRCGINSPNKDLEKFRDCFYILEIALLNMEIDPALRKYLDENMENLNKILQDTKNI